MTAADDRAGTGAPPVDPRTDLPPFGTLPTRARMDELADRVLAANPSPMTLDGTNTYVVGAPDAGEVVLVDPGPDAADHLDAVRATVADRDAEVVGILLTHHHHDHVAAAPSWSQHFGCGVWAVRPELVSGAGTTLADGDVLGVAGTRIEVVATPGHTADHVAFRLATGALLTGDHVLGRGTSVVAHPDGDLVAYLASLRRVLDLGPDVLLPGHGPELADDPQAVVAFYLEHREHRLGEVLAALRAGATSAHDVVRVVYAAYDEAVWPAAEASTRAALDVLVDRGDVVVADGGVRPA